MTLSPEEMINGSLSLVFLTTSMIIGLKILSKYFKYNNSIKGSRSIKNP